jgi:hypothetical protein
MSKFSSFENSVISGVKDLATGALKDFLVDAQNDAKGFLKMSEEDLKRWTDELASQKLDKDEFADLVDGEGDLAQLDALTQLGIAEADLQRFRDGLINLVKDAAFKAFL